ncbi:MAG: hypothetical protein U1F25_00695 [Rubrivivax sp.]
MAAALARALGEPVLHLSLSFADVAARPLPGAAGIANMFQFLHDFNEEVLAMQPLAAARAAPRPARVRRLANAEC